MSLLAWGENDSLVKYGPWYDSGRVCNKENSE